MPFVAYVHEPDHDPSPGGRPPWEPDWRIWRPLGLAVPAAFGAANSTGVASLVLALVAFALICRAANALLPEGDGMREWRQ